MSNVKNNCRGGILPPVRGAVSPVNGATPYLFNGLFVCRAVFLRIILPLISACFMAMLAVYPAIRASASAPASTAADTGSAVIYSCDEYKITETEISGEYSVDARHYITVDSRFYDGRAIISGRDGYGYVDKNGQVAIPFRYAKAYPFRGGIARVIEIDDSSPVNIVKISYIDTSGNAVDDPEKINGYYGFYYDISTLFNSAQYTGLKYSSGGGAVFRDGLALTKAGGATAAGESASAEPGSAGNKYTPAQTGETGRKYAPAADADTSDKYASAADAINKYAPAANTENAANVETDPELYGYVDENGDTIIPFDYEYGSVDFNENLAIAKKGGKLYVLEKVPVVKIPVDSPEVKGKHIPILMYHSVAEVPHTSNSVLFVRPSELEAQLNYIADNGFQTITFEDLDNVGAFPKPIMLTFDDGYKDSYTILFPLLKQYNMKATVFMITDAVWSDEFITPEEIKEMSDSGLVSIQSHTVSHPYLTDVGKDKLLRELSESKAYLEDLIGKPVIALCYPTGKQNATVRTAVADYYKYAVLMGGGQYVCGGNLLAMNRVYIKRGINTATFAQLVN